MKFKTFTGRSVPVSLNLLVDCWLFVKITGWQVEQGLDLKISSTAPATNLCATTPKCTTCAALYISVKLAALHYTGQKFILLHCNIKVSSLAGILPRQHDATVSCLKMCKNAHFKLTIEQCIQGYLGKVH